MHAAEEVARSARCYHSAVREVGPELVPPSRPSSTNPEQASATTTSGRVLGSQGEKHPTQSCCLLLLLLYIQIKEGTVPLATRPLFLKVQVDAIEQFRACAVGRRARTGGASDDSEFMIQFFLGYLDFIWI